MKNNAKCPKCKQGYVMGWNGTVDGCDSCLGIVRDSNGHAWYPGEQKHLYGNLDGSKTYTVSRRKAFNPKPR